MSAPSNDFNLLATLEFLAAALRAPGTLSGAITKSAAATRLDECIARLRTQSETGAIVAPIPSEFAQLASFYDVADMAALVRIQAEHIERLQKQLPPTPPFPGVNRVREG